MLLFVLAVLIFSFWSRFAHAHDWYDYACCSGRDCFALEDGEVTLLPGREYLIVASGETFAHPDNEQFQRRARWSKDGRFHRCTINGDRKAPVSICLYVVPPGS